MIHYIHQYSEWPDFRWDIRPLAEKLAFIRHQQGLLLGKMTALGFEFQQEASLETLTEEVVKSSEIEGEKLDMEQVRSSLARQLGLDIGALESVDRNVEGIVEVMLDATRNYDAPLTQERLFSWHAALFPTGHRRMLKIKVGCSRDDSKGPMQVVSGSVGREKVHYEAPAANILHKETQNFLEWVNLHKPTDPILKAGIAHLWFVSIHPFDDGNGHIARAIADLVLANSEKTSQRFYSMSAEIRKQRKIYYDLLESTQKGDMDITPWLNWFIECLGQAINGAEDKLAKVLFRSNFWKSVGNYHINPRQKLVLSKFLSHFEGKLTSSKWSKLAKCSQDTAIRDIDSLLKQGILIKSTASGRSTSYELKAVS